MFSVFLRTYVCLPVCLFFLCERTYARKESMTSRKSLAAGLQPRTFGWENPDVISKWGPLLQAWWGI